MVMSTMVLSTMIVFNCWQPLLPTVTTNHGYQPFLPICLEYWSLPRSMWGQSQREQSLPCLTNHRPAGLTNAAGKITGRQNWLLLNSGQKEHLVFGLFDFPKSWFWLIFSVSISWRKLTKSSLWFSPKSENQRLLFPNGCDPPHSLFNLGYTLW